MGTGSVVRRRRHQPPAGCASPVSTPHPTPTPQGLDEGVGDHDEFIAKQGPAFVEACQANRNCFQTLDTEYSKLTGGVVFSHLETVKQVLKSEGWAAGRGQSGGGGAAIGAA